MQIGALEIQLFADIARLQRDMNRANQVVDRATSGMARAAEMAKAAFASIAGGLSLGAIVNELVTAQREFDKLNSSLITATGSAEGASAAYKSLQAFAATTPYSVADATEAFIKMKNLGLDPSERALRSYGNTASAMGKDLNQMVEAVADAATGEFERLKEFGIKASDENGKVEMTFRGVKTSIGNNAKEIQAYLRKLGEVEFAGAMERRAKTLDGAISGLADAWDSFKLSLAQSGVGDAAEGSVRKLTGVLEDLGKSVGVLTAGFVTAAKVGASYIASMVVAPVLFQAVATAVGNLRLQIALARMEMASGATAASLFSASLGGVAVSAQWASGMLGKLTIASNVLFSAFAGWQIGSYLEEQFVQVKVFAEVLTGAVLEMWEHIKLGSKLALDAMTAMWRATFSGLALSLAPMYEGIAAGLRKIGFDEKAGQIEEFAGRVRAAGEAQGTFASRTAEARAEHERNIKAIRMVTDSHVAAVVVAESVSEATRGTAAASAAAAKEAKEMSKEQKKAFEDAKNFIEGQERELEAIGKTEAQQRMLNAARAAALAPTKQQRDRIMQLAEAINNESEAWKLAENARDAAAKADDKHWESLRAGTAAIDERIAQMQREVEMYGLTASAAVDAEKAKLEAKLAAGPATYAELAALDAQIEKLGQLADLVHKKETLDASKKAADQIVEDQQRIWGDIERTAHDTFISIFDSGKSAFDRLKDALKNGLYELLYQMTIKKWIVNIQANTSGGGGNALSSLGGSNGFSMANLGSMISSIGGTFGASSISAFGEGMGMTKMAAARMGGGAYSAGASAGSFLSVAGWIAAGMAAADALYKKGYDPNNGSTNTALTNPLVPGAMHNNKIFQALGMNAKWANMFSGASVVTALFGRKNPEIESQGIRGTLGGSGFTGEAYAKILEKGGLFRSDKRYEKTAAVSAEQDAALDATFKGLMEAAKGFASTLGIEASVIEGYNKQIKLQLGDDEAKNQEAIAKLFGEVGDELSLRLVPSLTEFKLAGESASVTLQRLVTNYATVDQALTAIGMQFGAVGVASIEARERLVEGSGGLEAFVTNMTGFQQNFLSEAERNAPVLKLVTEQMAALGYAAVDTRLEFKELLLSLNPSDEADGKLLASLLKVQAAFAQVYPVMDATADAVAKLAEVNKPYLDQITALERGLMSSADRRTAEIAGMDASTVALYDRVAALNLETAARSKAADEAKSLQDQYDELTMSTAQLAEKQRNALDPSNRARWDEIQAIKAHQEASVKATEAIRAAQESAAAAVRSLGDAFSSAIDRAIQTAKALREFDASLKLGSLSALDPDARYREAKKQFEAADAGDTQAMQAFLQASKDRGADSFYYQRDFAAVQEKLAKGIAEADARPAALAGLYRDMANWLSTPTYTPPVTPAAPVVNTGSMSGRSAQQTDNSRVVEALEKVSSKLDKLEVIANSTSQTAEHIDRVTNGGDEMKVKQ